MQPEGDPFKYLGVLFDRMLTMADEISRLTQKARAKVTAIVRSRCFYTVRELVQQYRTHVLCLLDESNGSICHASPTHLSKFDKVQKRFLDEIGLDQTEAFLEHSIAPLQLRKSIGMLGFLHKVVLGLAHPDILTMFPMALPSHSKYRLRSGSVHNKQLATSIEATDLMVLRRLVFGAIQAYNK